MGINQDGIEMFIIPFAKNQSQGRKIICREFRKNSLQKLHHYFKRHWLLDEFSVYIVRARKIKKKKKRETIVELKISENKTVINDREMLKEIQNFYGDLYTSRFSGSEELFGNFVENVALPKLSEVDINTLEGELTVQECRQILKTFSRALLRRQIILRQSLPLGARVILLCLEDA